MWRLPNPGFNVPRLLTGLTALAVGALFYLLERPAGQTYFLPEQLGQPSAGAPFLGPLGHHLPTFLHTFAFSLLTAALLRVQWRGALIVCTGWLITESLFEVGQAQPVAEWIAEILPAGFDGIPVLENIDDYFLQGRFDPVDLLSIALGAAAALPVMLMTRRYDPPN